ncbi:MAG: HAMP domain-containing protein [Deferribacteraceae bacterium]|jgi:two-component system nitrogen regulation sensor histidine kinase NtrY|nr:HAMP domain-containing protein [Deferribacteraceae bacterium]
MEKLSEYFYRAARFFTGSSKESRRRRTLRFSLYFVIVITADIILGKNITHSAYPWYSNISSLLMLNINIILVLVLIIIFVRDIARLMTDRRENVFGARLQTKLIVYSMVIVLVPVFLIYVISIYAVRGGIDRWFDQNVDRIMQSAINLYKGHMDESFQSITVQSEYLAYLIQDKYGENIRSERVRRLTREYIDRRIFNGTAVYSKTAPLYVQQNVSADLFGFIDPLVLSAVLSGAVRADYRRTGDISFYWCATPIKSGSGEVIGALFTLKTVSDNISKNSETMQAASGTWREMRFYSYPMRNSFSVFVTLVAILIAFGGMWGSRIFMRSVTIPLKELAKASEELSAGNLDIAVEVTGSDELTQLSRSFNDMAGKLRERTNELNKKNKDLASAFEQISKDKRNIDTIYQNVDSGIVLYDKFLNILKANALAETALMKMDKTALGLTEFIFGNEEEKFYQFELSIDGEEKVFTAHLNKLFDEDGFVENVLLVIDEITHIVNFQRITLWKEVATRIAHEIKNPLTPIKLTAERVRKRSQEIASPSARELVDKSMQTIINETEELLTLVEEFNLYARPISTEKTEIRLKKLVEQAAELQLRVDRRITINIDIPEELTIDGNPSQLKRAFVNLLQNALQAIGENNGEVEIRAVYLSADSEKKEVLITVRDNGEGIRDEDIARIFVPYFSQKPGGTGLGLAIVKKIIEEHGGEISVESKVGEFTEFRIILPNIRRTE